MAATTKTRQPRLRASCDGCFLAKVKCSKARPICSRCLTCGIECRYSPSSRAGKPKASDTIKNQQQHQQQQQQQQQQQYQQHNVTLSIPPVHDGIMFHSLDAGMAGVYEVDQGWTTPPASIDGAISRSQSISSGLTFLGLDTGPPPTTAAMDSSSLPTSLYGPTMPWTPPTDMHPAAFGAAGDPSIQPLGHSRSQSYDMANSVCWSDAQSAASPDLFSFSSQVSTPPQNMSHPHFTSSPAATTISTTTTTTTPTPVPGVRPPSTRPKSTAPSNGGVGGGSCTCFTVCLQSLQALHNASAPSPPPFDLVLSLNRKAVEGCAAMLACIRCMSRSGTHTAAMLLATVLGTITAFYRDACQAHFDQGTTITLSTTSTSTTPIIPATNTAISEAASLMAGGGAVTGLGVTLGAYTVNVEDSRWLELEILARELRKLEEVYSTFREVCSELSEDPEVSKAMVGYLGQSLGSTMQVITHQKGDMGFAVC